MRKVLAAAIVAASLGLGGCATDPTTGLPTLDPVALNQIELQVQQGTAAACSFVPTIESIASVIASLVGLGPVVGVAGQAVTAICTAVQAALPIQAQAGRRMFARSAAAPIITAQGVVINGYFLK